MQKSQIFILYDFMVINFYYKKNNQVFYFFNLQKIQKFIIILYLLEFKCYKYYFLITFCSFFNNKLKLNKKEK